MVSFMKESQSCWELLATTTKPIILYGMGNGADKIIDWCEAQQVQVRGIFASDEFVRYQSFRGLTVEKYSDIINRFGRDILIVIAFASERPEVLGRFKELATAHETVAPHLPLFQEEETVSLAWLSKYQQQLEQVYKALADDESRQVMAAVLNYKLSGKISYLFACESQRQEDLKRLFTWSQEERYVDLGAYNGDTVAELLSLTGGRAKKIIAVEPDRRNCRKLRAWAQDQGLEVEVQEVGIWQEQGSLSFSDSGGRQSTFIEAKKTVVPVNSLDNIVAGRPVTYIKFDVEGAEVQALKGGAKTIRENRPKMLVAAYHYDVDIFRLPLLLWELNPEYSVYLRKHPYIPAWELNFLVTQRI